MFKSFDTNGDGYVSMEELDANLKPKTRRKIEMALEGGWTFGACEPLDISRIWGCLASC